ncbi:hypothetical protein SAMN02744035_01330, partial [Thalassobacter stenotrophicus DSM 16310]
MNKLIALVATLIASVMPACADVNADANRLFVEAMQAWKQSEQLTNDSLEQAQERLDLLTLVDENLNLIITENPSSNLAVQLLIGPVGPLSLDDLPEQIAEAEGPILVFRGNEQLTMAKAHLANGEIGNARVALVKATILTAQQIEDADGRAEALFFIAEAQAEAGDVAGALNTAQQIDRAWFRAVALASFSNAQSEAGDVSGSRVTIALALQAAQQVEDADGRAEVLYFIAEVQAKAGDVAGALNTAQQIEGATRASALRAIAEAQAKAGDVAGALSTAQQIEEADDRASAL